MFKRNSFSAAQTSAISQQLMDGRPVPPEAVPFVSFLESNAESLAAYNEAYLMVGSAVSSLATDEKIHEVATDAASELTWVRVTNGRRNQTVDSEDVAADFMHNLATVFLYGSKRAIANGQSLSNPLQLRAFNSNLGIESLGEGKFMPVFQTLSLASKIVDLSSSLKAAEGIRGEVARRYSDDLVDDSGLIRATTSFYELGDRGAEAVFLSQQFQDILAADILDLDRGGVVFESLAQIAEQRDYFLEDYVGAIVEGKSEPTLKAMTKMASDFIESSTGEQASEAEILLATRDRWADYDIASAGRFGAYAKGRIAAGRLALRGIAGIGGSGRRVGLRMPVTEDDLNLSIISFRNLVSRSTRPQEKTVRARAAQNFQLPSELLEEAEAAGSTPYLLSVAKKQEGNRYVIEACEDNKDSQNLQKTVESFAKGNDALREDVLRMISQIQIAPFHYPERGQGVGFMRNPSGVMTVTLNGQQAKLIEFSPQDRNFSLKSGKEGKRTRIVYAVQGDEVVIFDILRHDDLDRIYRKNK